MNEPRVSLPPVPEAPAIPIASALERVYRDAYPRLLAVAAGIAGDAESGREAVQEAFVRMLASPGPRDQDALRAWVWRCVVNAARDTRRRRRVLERLHRTRREPDQAGGLPPQGDPVVRAALAALPHRQRTALFLRYYADLDYTGIARVMGVAPGTVASTLHAAHDAMRGVLEERP